MARSYAESIDFICGNLPIGWHVEITLERDAGALEVFDDDLRTVDFPQSFELGLAGSLADLCEWLESNKNAGSDAK